MNISYLLRASVACFTLAFAANALAEDGCLADIDGDGLASGADLGRVLGSWGPCADCAADLNGNGIVNGEDLSIVLSRWGLTCDPTVTGMTPQAAGLTGDVVVQITGDRLARPTSVTFGGTPGTILTSARESVSVIAPARTAGAATVVVSTPGGSIVAGTFNYYEAPSITTVSPNEGPAAGGTIVTINGAGFDGSPLVRFGTISSPTVNLISPSEIHAVTPAGTAGSTVAIEVETAWGIGTRGQAFAYTTTPGPAILKVHPYGGPTNGGTDFGIFGIGLTGATSVMVGGRAATQVWVLSDGQVNARTPSGNPGPVSVSISTPNGTASIANGFTYFSPPTVSSISTVVGPAGGGTSVTILGTRFLGVQEVLVCNKAAPTFTVVNDSTITFLTPVMTPNASGGIRVWSPGGYSSNCGSAPQFYSFGEPVATSISPSAGPLAGGTPITITGSNLTFPFNGSGSPTFDSYITVSIGGTPVPTQIVQPTAIRVTTPAGTAGVKTVTVTTPGGTTSVEAGFTYRVAPSITSIAPSAGPTNGGTAVTIVGTDLAGTTSVSFGGTAAASINVVDSNTVIAVTPKAAAGVKSVSLTTPGGTANLPNAFTYFDVPTISAVTPGSGSMNGGNSITITGTNLTATSAVAIGGAPATGVTVVNASKVTAVTPIGTEGPKGVSVTTPAGTATLANAFTYAPVPTITSVVPTGGPLSGGTVITITGTNLTGASSVTLGGAAASSVTVVNPTTITAVTPSGVGLPMIVSVTTLGGTASLPNGFTYFGIPGIVDVTPWFGRIAGNDAITITGVNLTGATSIKIGGVPATGLTVVDDRTVTARTPGSPGGGAGTYPVSITTPGGTATKTNGFTYAF
jgi:hypothetical protein